MYSRLRPAAFQVEPVALALLEEDFWELVRKHAHAVLRPLEVRQDADGVANLASTSLMCRGLGLSAAPWLRFNLKTSVPATNKLNRVLSSTPARRRHLLHALAVTRVRDAVRVPPGQRRGAQRRPTALAGRRAWVLATAATTYSWVRILLAAALLVRLDAACCWRRCIAMCARRPARGRGLRSVRVIQTQARSECYRATPLASNVVFGLPRLSQGNNNRMTPMVVKADRRVLKTDERFGISDASFIYSLMR